MRLALGALIENDALNVELAFTTPLDVDVYVAQFQPTRDWPPELGRSRLTAFPAPWRVEVVPAR